MRTPRRRAPSGSLARQGSQQWQICRQQLYAQFNHAHVSQFVQFEGKREPQNSVCVRFKRRSVVTVCEHVEQGYSCLNKDHIKFSTRRPRKTRRPRMAFRQYKPKRCLGVPNTWLPRGNVAVAIISEKKHNLRTCRLDMTRS